jgi:hypothetical protein
VAFLPLFLSFFVFVSFDVALYSTVLYCATPLIDDSTLARQRNVCHDFFFCVLYFYDGRIDSGADSEAGKDKD